MKNKKNQYNLPKSTTLKKEVPTTTHPDIKLAIELRCQAHDLESQAASIKSAANVLIEKHLKEGDTFKHPNDSYGKIVYCKSSTSSTLDKDTLKLKLIERGVPANVVVEAFKASTTTKPKAGGIKYYPEI